MILGARLSCRLVYDFCLWYCVVGLGGYHEVTAAFMESISGPSPNYC